MLYIRCLDFIRTFKGQFISKCPFGVIVSIGAFVKIQISGLRIREIVWWVLQGVSVQNDKFKIMITVALSYIRKHSWQLACSNESTI